MGTWAEETEWGGEGAPYQSAAQSRAKAEPMDTPLCT